MSRSKAKESIDLTDFVSEMKDVFSTTVNRSTLDEAPMAYKPMEEIMENIKDTVDILKVIKPIYNFKASE
jgi:RNA-splicing ligase RtcB